MSKIKLNIPYGASPMPRNFGIKAYPPTDKAIEPTHLETSLYVAALEVASRRGYPASEVRVYSPLHPSERGARWFDGRAWFFTWRQALIEAIQEEARLYPLDLLAWREQPPPEEGVELFAVLSFRHKHEWNLSMGGSWCRRCLCRRDYQSDEPCEYELIQDNYRESTL